MIDMENRLLLKTQLSDCSVSILHHTVVLLLLTHSCGGQSQVISPPQPIVAMVGDDIILPCHLEPAVDAVNLTVEWARPDLDPRFVHLRRDRVDLLNERHPSYMSRTSLSTTKMKCGDISLKLSTVKLSDAGMYNCLVPKSGSESVVELVVGSVSSPDIEISIVSNRVMLDCKSKGWYPEPEVLWLDGEGNLLPAGPTETVRGPDGLYTVSSRVTVEKRHSNSFTCRVQQKNINQTRETHIHVPGDFFVAPSSSSVRITISLVACSVCVLMVLIVAWKINRNKLHQDKTQLGEREKAREHLMTESEKMEYLDTANAKLDEEFQRSEEELQHVEKVISTLTEQKMDLKNQREQVTSLKQELRILMEAVTNKDLRKNIRKDLESKKMEYKKLLPNTDKILVATEDMIIRMTERKGKLEKEKEQINKHLKKTEKQREEETSDAPINDP
ncbi:butyrophilin subfamily 3 member A2-like [Trachinotus anak]|uniref:butyrophilin subfamily 3 member A2-like n=1 Tax=Trachinotus anak TaxID=443729 RepID=UPI0039F22EF2